jgi:predicted TIM-barrel fold metal-dependent hydrolase
MWLLDHKWNVAATILHNLIPFSDKDVLDRYKAFVQTFKLGSSKAIFEQQLTQYPKDTKFIALSMDMSLMGAGKVPRQYTEQLIELIELRDEYPNNIIPFIHIDCRRDDYEYLVSWAISNGFRGVKLYPPIGVFPFDSRHDYIFEYCEKNNIPIFAHCTDGSPVHYRGSKKELKKLLSQSKVPIDYSLSQKELCNYFTHPDNYRDILKKHPKLNISLCHFGRGNEWDKIILDMMEEYDNLWVDISYSMSNEENWAPFKINLITNPKLRERCCMGSDYFMVQVECTEKQFSIKFRAYIGEELWNQIAVTNPQKLLCV